MSCQEKIKSMFYSFLLISPKMILSKVMFLDKRNLENGQNKQNKIFIQFCKACIDKMEAKKYILTKCPLCRVEVGEFMAINMNRQ